MIDNKKYFIWYTEKKTDVKGKQFIYAPNLISMVSMYNRFKEENTDLFVYCITAD